MIQTETKHHMGRRCHGWDYGQRAIYMITVNLAERGKPVLAGWPVPATDALDEVPPGSAPGCVQPGFRASSLAAKHFCPLTPFGETVLACWREIPTRWPMVSLIDAVVMPDHFHGILFVRERLPAGKTLGNVVGSFKSRSTSLCLAMLGRTRPAAEPPGPPLVSAPSSMPGFVRPSSVPGRVRPSSAPGRVRPGPRASPCTAKFWADGFVDTILFRQGQLESMVVYIRENPDRLAEKRANPELFRRIANLSLPLDGGRMTGRFEAIGNRHLLRRPLHQVQCSRSFFAYRRIPKPGGGLKIARDATGEPIVERTSPDYEARLEAALDAAAHGAVVLSPCISDGERQIAREALLRGLPLITLQNKGFSPLQKPPGRYFEACAEDRLLMMAPAAWPYTTQEKPMTRFDATALNRLSQWLAGEDAVEINYHGMTPANIDQLAMQAVR